MHTPSPLSSETPTTTTAPRAPVMPAPTPPPIVQPVLEDRTEPITGYKKAMVKAMTNALKIPHFGFSDEVILNTLMT